MESIDGKAIVEDLMKFEEISPRELLAYEEEILEAIEKSKLPGEEKRGLMKYYDSCDSLNAKVSKYEFTVEEVKGELMGVAVLTLNDALTDKELELIKSEITGQASDGFGEGFEQRPIKTPDGEIYVLLNYFIMARVKGLYLWK